MPKATSTPFDPPSAADLREQIRDQALALGFDACGFGPARIPDRNRARYEAFIDQGEHGTMDWMQARLEQRTNPQALAYINRLSDYLFVLARTANDGGRSDIKWVPGANR